MVRDSTSSVKPICALVNGAFTLIEYRRISNKVGEKIP